MARGRQMTEKSRLALEEEEGRRNWPYDDKTGQKVQPGQPVFGTLTAGIGHTGPDVVAGDFWSNDRIDKVFDQDNDKFESVVERTMVGANGEIPNDNEFDACVRCAFNIGEAGWAGSSMVRNWKHPGGPDKQAVADSFTLWNRDSSGVNNVLVARRARERALFLTVPPVVDGQIMPKPIMPQEVAPPPGAASNNVVRTAAVAVGPPAIGIAIENVGPAINVVKQAADQAQQAVGAWNSVKAAVGPLMNGHVLTFVAAAIIIGGAVYIGVRVTRRIWAGKVAAK